MTHREQFLTWWKDDPERAKCFLEQAMDAYVRSFPARALPLLCELVKDDPVPELEPGLLLKPPSTTASDLAVSSVAEQDDPTAGPVEGGVLDALHGIRDELKWIQDTLDNRL